MIPKVPKEYSVGDGYLFCRVKETIVGGLY
jgi:hypothetical protein